MTDRAKLALCISGWDAVLKEGRVYEVVPVPCLSDGRPLFIVPQANTGFLSTCRDCGFSAGLHWWRSRFIPINDAEVKDDVPHDEEIAA